MKPTPQLPGTTSTISLKSLINSEISLKHYFPIVRLLEIMTNLHNIMKISMFILEEWALLRIGMSKEEFGFIQKVREYFHLYMLLIHE